MSNPPSFSSTARSSRQHWASFTSPNRSSVFRRRRCSLGTIGNGQLTLIGFAIAITFLLVHHVGASSPNSLAINIRDASSPMRWSRWLEARGGSSSIRATLGTTSRALFVCRGGGTNSASGRSSRIARILKQFFSFGSQTPAQKYREMLEDQVLLMDRQLRQTRDELTRLREQWTVKTGPPDGNSAIPNASKEELAALKQQVSTLTLQVKQLTKMKEELEEMLEKEQARVDELEEALAQERQLTKELQEGYERQLKELQVQLEKKAQKQLDDLRKLMEQRVEQAAEAARISAQRMVQEQIDLATTQLRLEQQREMDAERRRSEQAVDAEKRKMRKLVKALAIREKKILAKQQRQRARSAVDEESEKVLSTTKSKLPASRIPSSRRTPTHRPPTTRGPMR